MEITLDYTEVDKISVNETIWNGNFIKLQANSSVERSFFEKKISPLLTKCSREGVDAEIEVVGTVSKDDKGNTSGSASVKVTVKTKDK